MHRQIRDVWINSPILACLISRSKIFFFRSLAYIDANLFKQCSATPEISLCPCTDDALQAFLTLRLPEDVRMQSH